MIAFILHGVALALLAFAAIHHFDHHWYTDRLRLGFGGMAIWMAGDLVAQYMAFGAPW